MSTTTFTKTHNLIAFLEKPSKSDGFKQIVDFLNANQIKYALTVSPTIYPACIKQFWTTFKIKSVNDDVWLQALVDGKKVVITEASIRHDLKLNDAEGTSCLSNAVIFEELARMEVVTPLFGTMMVQVVKEVGDLPTAVQDTPIPDAPSSSQHQRKHKPKRKKRKKIEVSLIELHREDHVPTTFNDLLLSGEDRMQLKELMVLCTNLQNKVLNMENKVIKMKSSYKAKIAELESRVEKLKEENKRKYADAEVNLENVFNLDMAHEETVLSMQDVTDADVKEVTKEMVEVITSAKIIVDEVSTTGGELNAANEKPVSDVPTNITTAQPIKKAHIAIEEEVARRIEAEWNVDIKDNIDWNKVVERRLDLHLKKDTTTFKPCSRKAQRWMQKRIIAPRKRTRKEKVEKDQNVKKQKSDELEQNNTEKQKLEEQQEAEELKRNLEIVHDDEDDVFVNVTPLSSKPLTIMDYKIYKEGKKEHF
uniref:Xylulose kinase-1 n=1 Tax=Tanacetum cinerariifolium TaxID=118510 RepID=A0A6L2NRK3_TANCI|nr:hypothetical protein [Tanacetum cinerariifolium]